MIEFFKFQQIDMIQLASLMQLVTRGWKTLTWTCAKLSAYCQQTH